MVELGTATEVTYMKLKWMKRACIALAATLLPGAAFGQTFTVESVEPSHVFVDEVTPLTINGVFGSNIAQTIVQATAAYLVYIGQDPLGPEDIATFRVG